MIDGAAQARGGVCSVTGEPDGPPTLPGAMLADYARQQRSNPLDVFRQRFVIFFEYKIYDRTGLVSITQNNEDKISLEMRYAAAK